jgi:hypothetical protein
MKACAAPNVSSIYLTSGGPILIITSSTFLPKTTLPVRTGRFPEGDNSDAA